MFLTDCGSMLSLSYRRDAAVKLDGKRARAIIAAFLPVLAACPQSGTLSFFSAMMLLVRGQL